MQIEIDEIPALPEFKQEELHEIDLYQAIGEFTNSSNKFMFYENSKGELRFFFEKLDAPLYAALVVKLSNPAHSKAYEFLKLVLEGVRLVKQSNKKGYDMAVKVEKYIDKGV
jgi:hypothetical protein